MTYKRPTVMVEGKQMLVSRHVMEKRLGRKLASSELVHHKNENPFDNDDLNNLQIVSRAEHKRIHRDIGIATRFTKIHRFDSSELLELYNQTLTFKEIAAMKGCSEVTIRRFLKPLLGVKDLRQLRFRHKGKPCKGRKPNEQATVDSSPGGCSLQASGINS